MDLADKSIEYLEDESISIITSAESVQKGDVIWYENRPVIVDIKQRRLGKYPWFKFHFFDFFRESTLMSEIYTLDSIIYNLIVTKREYQLLNINEDDYVTLMDDQGNYIEDCKLPKMSPGTSFVNNLKADFDNNKDLILTLSTAMRLEGITGYRLAEEPS